MKPLQRHVLMIAATLLATLAGYFAAQYRDNEQRPPLSEPPPANAARATQKLLTLTLPDPKGGTQSLSQWRGKVLVVNFWATWCTPCRKEIPGFSSLQKQFASKNVQFVGIAIDSADKVNEFSRQTPAGYPFLIADQALTPIMVELGNMAGGLPFTVVIGRDGRLFQSRLGIWKESALEAILDDLTQKAE